MKEGGEKRRIKDEKGFCRQTNRQMHGENKMNFYLGKVYTLTIYRSSSKLVKSSEYILYSLPGQITMIQ